MPSTNTTELRGYCDACEALVVIAEPQESTTNTGKVFVEGQCPECGGSVTAIPPKND